MQSWPDYLVSKLRELKEIGLSASQIGDKLGLTRNAVIGKWNRLGESRPASSQELSRNGRKGGKARRKTIKAATKRLRPQPLPPEPPLPFVLPPARGIGSDALLKLKASDCRWPIGDARDPEFRFCGAAHGRSSMYCDHHYVASVKPENGNGENGA